MSTRAFDFPAQRSLAADSWRQTGAAIVRGLLADELIDRLAAVGDEHFPPPGSDAAQAIRDFGSNLNFPSQHSALNEATLHPDLLSTVAELLRVSINDLRLTQSDLWAKYGRPPSASDNDNADQRIHVDFPNHTLVHPPPWNRPEAVEIIVYLTDSDGVGGGTAVVPRQGDDDPLYTYPITASPGIGTLPWINNRANAESYLAEHHPDIAEFRALLYGREELVSYRAGDVLLYRHDTWHRGTPLAQGARRCVMNMTFRRADAEWVSTLHKGWAWSAYHPNQHFERLIANATVEQRTVLGFPAPGSDYWCEETLAAVEARYGELGFDGKQYRAGLRK